MLKTISQQCTRQCSPAIQSLWPRSMPTASSSTNTSPIPPQIKTRMPYKCKAMASANSKWCPGMEPPRPLAATKCCPNSKRKGQWMVSTTPPTAAALLLIPRSGQPNPTSLCTYLGCQDRYLEEISPETTLSLSKECRPRPSCPSSLNSTYQPKQRPLVAVQMAKCPKLAIKLKIRSNEASFDENKEIMNWFGYGMDSITS